MKCRALLALLLVASCSDTTPTIVDQLNLDRPIDVAFSCFGDLRITNGAEATSQQPVIQSAEPLSACDFRSGPHDNAAPAPVPPNQGTVVDADGTSTVASSSYYAFILQNEQDTVAIATWDTKPPLTFSGGGQDVHVLDANPLIPGNNGIAVGEDPIGIATSIEGCFEITANAGSCDLSTIDVTSALVSASQPTKTRPIVNRLNVTTATGAVLRAKPAAMVGEPPSGVLGNACPAQPTGLVYIAYPSCHLVAGVDAGTGQIVTGLLYDTASMTWKITDGNVTCPEECGGNGVATPGPRPVAIDLDLDERTQRRVLAIGSQNTNQIVVVDLDASDRPIVPTFATLEQSRTNDLGVTSLAISPTMGMGGDGGFINDESALGGEMQFIYAVTTDNTVRVLNIEGAINKECDAQVDPRYLHAVGDVKRLSCMFVGDPTTPPRRAGARGPGIQLPGDANPTSVDFVKAEAVPGAGTGENANRAPAILVGYFAAISASSGLTFIANVDDDSWSDTVDPGAPVRTAIPLDIAHQLRDSVPFRDVNANVSSTTTGGMTVNKPGCDTDGVAFDSSEAPSESTRYTGSTTRTIPTGYIANEKVGILPSIRNVLCPKNDTDAPDGKVVSELSFAAPLDVRDQVFPDLLGLKYDDNYTMTYEGSLSTDTADSAVDGPAIRTSVMHVDFDKIRLIDATQPFCDAGVEPFDVVQLRGCDSTLGDGDCPIGYACFVHPDSQVPNLGACMLRDEADRLANACKPFLTSLRQYTVAKTTTGELQLLPRKHVLRTSPVDGCTSDDQCKLLANYAVQNISSNEPGTISDVVDTHAYSCQADPTRAPDPTGAQINRCVETCTVDKDCDAGSVCQAGTCYEGVLPPQACVNAPQRYELRSHDAFTLIGDLAGYHHAIIADPAGNCVKDTSPNRRFDVGRIPLTALPCDPTADPLTGLLPDGVTYEPNPCETTVDQIENATNYVPGGSCAVANPPTLPLTRQAPAIRFHGRGLNLTIVDPTYPGDQTCIGDRAGLGLGKIPVVPPLFQTLVRIISGFRPFVINAPAAYPVKVVRGPGESIWIMDEGDYLSTSLSLPSTRGKVFRAESQLIGTVSVLQ